MKIDVYNVRSYITEMPPYPWDKNLLNDFLLSSPKNYWKARKQAWSGKVQFVSRNFTKKYNGNMFPTGILFKILDWAEEQGIEVEVSDKRTELKPLGVEINADMLEGISMSGKRHYQLDAIEQSVKHARGLNRIATAGGKSAVIAGVIRAVDRKTLLLVERVTLATQLAKNIKEFIDSDDVGVVAGKHNDIDKKVIIATIQSAERYKHLFKDFEVVIVDEMHHAQSKSYLKVMRQLTNAYYRIGVSGTTQSGDPIEDMYRYTQFGDHIHETGTKTLVDAGILAKPTIYMKEIHGPPVENSTVYLNIYKEAICSNKERNEFIAKFANGLKGKRLILFRLIEHGQTLKELIPNAIYMDGDTDYDTREEYLKLFNSSKDGIMLASTIVDEGIDFSSLSSLFVASGEKSLIKVIQRLGRGLRTDGSLKDEVSVFDFYDRQHKITQRHSGRRKSIYQQEGHTIKIIP